MPRRPSINWPVVLDHARSLVLAQPLPIGLRRLHYLVVATLAPPAYFNDANAYRELGRRTAQLRREGRFPAMIDPSRTVAWPFTFEGADDALSWVRDQFLMDRRDRQEFQVWLAAEKRADADDLTTWFGREYGLPVVPLGGDHSEPIEREVREAREIDGRPSVLLICGDYDAKGVRIRANAVKKTGPWDHVVEVALNDAQVEAGNYVVSFKAPFATEGRFYRDWAALHGGRRVQVELQAMPAAELRQLYLDAITDPRWFDEAAYQALLATEEAERAQL